MWKWGLTSALAIAFLVGCQESQFFDGDPYLSAEDRTRVLEVLDQAKAGELISYPRPKESNLKSLDDVQITQRVKIGQSEIEAIREAFATPHITNTYRTINCFQPRHAVVLEVGKQEPAIFWICLSCENYQLQEIGYHMFSPPAYKLIKNVFLEAGFPLKPKDET